MTRLNAVGLADEIHAELPFTQEELGKATGLSTVHVNRTIRGLRDEGLAWDQAKTGSMSSTGRA